MNRTISLALAGLVGASAATTAAEPSASDRTLAETLFREGKKLMEAEDYAAACPKLAESQRLDPGGGTLLNLAVCHEKEGKTATAWAEFREALAQARKDGRDDRVKLAEKRIEAIEPKLPRVTVVVDEGSKIEGLTITIDGNAIGAPAWGTAVPVDPGEHVIEAVAPGRKLWSKRIEAVASKTESVNVPVLEPGPATAPTQPAYGPSDTPAAPSDAPPGGEDGSGQRTLGYVVAGVGVVGLGVGTVFGLQAISKRGDSDDECPDDQCTTRGVELNDEAKSAATLSNVGLGVGLVGLGVGAYLILTAGGSSERAARSQRRREHVALTPVAGRRGGGVFVTGSF